MNIEELTQQFTKLSAEKTLELKELQDELELLAHQINEKIDQTNHLRQKRDGLDAKYQALRWSMIEDGQQFLLRIIKVDE